MIFSLLYEWGLSVQQCLKSVSTFRVFISKSTYLFPLSSWALSTRMAPQG